MISAQGLINYCNNIYNSKAKYLWGADGEVGTKELLDNLIKKYGKDNYKDIKYSDIEGYLCFDCSGLLTNISGINTTAQGYYDKCIIKGNANEVPKNKVCLVFRKEGTKIVHVGVYLGDGNICEMWNGCEIKKFNSLKWTYYGIPLWIDITTQKQEELKVNDKIKTNKALTIYKSSYDAVNNKNALPNKYQAGEYYVYKIANGSVNITKTKGTAGAWVILTENDYIII